MLKRSQFKDMNAEDVHEISKTHPVSGLTINADLEVIQI